MAVVLERNLNEPSLDGSSAIFDKSTLQASKQKRSKNCLVLVPVYTTVAVLFFWPIAFLFFWLQAARVRVPGRLPFSQLKLPQRTDQIVETKRSSSMAKPKIELIKQINKKIDPPRSKPFRSQKTTKPFRSQVIDGAQEKEEDRRRAAMGFEIPVTRARIRS